ncbi:MAG: ribokinase [Tepidanaerobacteraceae bacterium]
MKKIVVVGSINMDVVIRVPHIPVVGETILAKGQKLFGGGKGANQAIAVSRLGGNVSMIGRIGNDEYGKKLHQGLVKSGVNVDGVEFDEKSPTGTAYIYVSDKGDNNIVVNPGANSRVDRNQIDRYESLFEGAEYCIIQMEIPIDIVEYVIGLCKKKGIKVMLNPAPAHVPSEVAYKDLYMILPNETELKILSGSNGNLEEMAESLYKKGVKNVIATLGENGCMLLNGKGIKYFPAPPFSPVDTTAAGDSFVAGVTVGLSEEMSMEKAIKLGSYAAGVTISKEGAQASIPDRKTVDSYLSENNKS